MNKQSMLAAALSIGQASEEMTKMHKEIDHAKQNTWYRKVMQRPQKSRHTRTKRGRK